MRKEVQVETVTGQLTHFIIEPFVPHEQSEEHREHAGSGALA